jgi:hypothetical protein
MKLGNYRLERVLGRGRMGVVYLARDEALLRPTAIKVLSWAIPEGHGHDPEAWLLAEARSIARVNHPSVIQVYSVARHGPHCYIAMEYVEGVSADRIVTERGPLDAMRATEILLRIAGALSAAHGCGVIHRDVKPANILIHTDGTAKLGDFGLALRRERGWIAAPGERVGTPQYTAPEIWRSESASPSTDLYALGATYYFLLTGRPPFEAADLRGMIAAHLNDEVPDARKLVPSVPEGCVGLVQRCMAKDPRERFESAQALAWEARGLLRSLESPSARRGRETDPPPAAREGGMDASLAFFGFVRPPFSDFDVEPDLESFEPFAAVGRAIRSALGEAHGATIVLAGERGSGRRRLLRGVLAKLPRRGPVAWLEPDSAGSRRPLDLRACSAFGAVPSAHASAAGGLEGLLEHLESVCTADGGPALLVVDATTPTPSLAAELAMLSRAAGATQYFSLVVVGDAASAPIPMPAEAPGDAGAPFVLRLPPLGVQDVLAYVRRRLRAALPPGAPPVLFTPDGAILLAHRAKGNFAKLNRLATGAIQLATRRRSRVISSWDAWVARDLESIPLPADPRRSSMRFEPIAAWPTPEAHALIDAGRRVLGLAPRARAAG